MKINYHTLQLGITTYVASLQLLMYLNYSFQIIKTWQILGNFAYTLKRYFTSSVTIVGN